MTWVSSYLPCLRFLPPRRRGPRLQGLLRGLVSPPVLERPQQSVRELVPLVLPQLARALAAPLEPVGWALSLVASCPGLERE